MRERQHEFQQAGASLAAIGLGDLRYAALFREETGITFPLLVDASQVAYKAAELKSGNLFHVLRRDNAAARARARAAGHHQHRTGQNPFQLGASFIFAPGNRDVFAHFNQTFSDDATPETLLTALRSLPSVS